MKTLAIVFVFAVALACCATTCGALKCRDCSAEATKEDCMNQASQTTCNSTYNYCLTTHTKIPNKSGEQWHNVCGTTMVCEAGNTTNTLLCTPSASYSICVYCCDTDGCVGGPESATTTPASGHGSIVTAHGIIVTMATAALAVLLNNMAGF